MSSAQRGASKPAVTDREARAAMLRILREVFDVPAVLQRRKSISELAGLLPVCGMVGVQFLTMAITALRQNTSRKLVGTMYLRDTATFLGYIGQQAALSVLYQVVSTSSRWLRTRVSIAWRRQLTEKLHAVYFGRTEVYYRQTTWSNSIADPPQRIVSDVTMLLGGGGSYSYGGLTSTVQSYITTSLGAFHAMWRLWFNLPGQRWLGPFLVVWSFATIRFRNRFAPAMRNATIMAKRSRISGAYRDSHSRLSRYAESIIAFGGVEAEKTRITTRLAESLNNAWESAANMVREDLAMSLVGESFLGKTVEYALVHIPMISAFHPLKVSSSASEERRMQSNADVLAEMSFNGELIRQAQWQISALFRLNRTMVRSSGSAIRVAEVLDLRKRAPGTELQTGTRAHGLETPAIELRNVDLVTPSGVKLVDDLSLNVSKGQAVQLYGASGVGKTALCRTLKGLWPTGAGEISCPTNTMFLPQTPYCPPGSLQDQLLYPADLKTPMSEHELRGYLQEVKLEHLIGRENSAIMGTGLSLSEKQQMAVARVLRNKPEFVVLDEATSSVDQDLELELFQKISSLGITMITISNNAALLPFHQRVLKLKRGGDEAKRNWSVIPIQDKTEFPSPIQRATRSIDPAVSDSQGIQKKPQEKPARTQALPKCSDIARTLMLAKLAVPEFSLADQTVLRMIASSVLMGINIWVRTSFINSVPGVLQSFTMQSDLRGYLKFTRWTMTVRLFSMITSLLQQWVQSGIAIMWRERITQSITDRYIHNNRFYTMAHVDKRVQDADSRIAVEIDQFVQSLSMLYSPWRGIVRTFFNTIYVTMLLLRVNLPRSGLIAMVSYGTVGIGLIKMFAPDFTHFNVEMERCNARFRDAHNQVNSALESVAFSGGGHVVERQLNAVHESYLTILSKQNNQSSLWNPVQSFMLYSLPMYIRQGLQFLWSFGEGSDTQVLENRGGTQMQEMSQYIGTLIEQAFQTMSSIMGMHQQFAALFGSARRISDVLLVLEELEQQEQLRGKRQMASEHSATTRLGQRLSLHEVDVSTPDDKTILLHGLTLSVEAHGRTNVLLTASQNGVGKSAVARVLAGIWLPASGHVGRPLDGCALVPQQPLVPTCPLSLLDMLTYPVQLVNEQEVNVATKTLSVLMKRLRVSYALYPITATCDIIQGRQALGVIRTLFHRPGWVVLDECLSAMPEDTIVECYRLLEEYEISVVSIGCSSDQVRKFHVAEVNLDGQHAKGWSVSTLKPERCVDNSEVQMPKLDLAEDNAGREADAQSLKGTAI